MVKAQGLRFWVGVHACSENIRTLIGYSDEILGFPVWGADFG